MSQVKVEILRQAAELARLAERWSALGREDLAQTYRTRAENLSVEAEQFE